jgi:hypothetical protein
MKKQDLKPTDVCTFRNGDRRVVASNLLVLVGKEDENYIPLSYLEDDLLFNGTPYQKRLSGGDVVKVENIEGKTLFDRAKEEAEDNLFNVGNIIGNSKRVILITGTPSNGENFEGIVLLTSQKDNNKVGDSCDYWLKYNVHDKNAFGTPYQKLEFKHNINWEEVTLEKVNDN